MPSDATVSKRIGQLLRHQRIDVLHLTLQDVERLTEAKYRPGIRFQQVQKLEQGETERPSLRDITILCDVYGLDLSEVVRVSGLAYPDVPERKDTDTQRTLKTLVNALLTTANDEQLAHLIPLLQAVAGHFRSPAPVR